MYSYLYLFSIIVLSQQCFGIYINITNEQNDRQRHSDKPFKPPDVMINDQGDPESSDVVSGYFDLFSKYIYGSPVTIDDMVNATTPPSVMNKGADLSPSSQPESQDDIGSSKQLSHLPDNNMQDDSDDVNLPESHVDVGSLDELNLPSNSGTQDASSVTKESRVKQPDSQVEVDVFESQVVAQWVAAIIFLIIATYAVIFIIAVALLECKGKGRRTVDDERYGSPVEKQKLLNGAAMSEDTKDYQIGDQIENFDKSYTNFALQLENSTTRNYHHNQPVTDRSDLHHLLGSPIAEVEVFPHGSLQRPPKKGCLQY